MKAASGRREPARSQRHQEYVEYYRARAERYRARPLYANTHVVDQELLAAIEEAPDMEAFQAVVEERALVLESAKALVRDQEYARLALYKELDEPVRASAPKAILAGLDRATDGDDLTSMTTRARLATDAAVNVDVAPVDALARDLVLIENIEVWARAPVPDRWRTELDGWVHEAVALGTQSWEAVVNEIRRIEPGWRFDEASVWETRHRYRFPYPDKILHRRLEQHRRFRGR